jgi:hypothetical protein
MKKLLVLSVLMASSVAMADCPQLAGNYQYGVMQETVTQDHCASVTFTAEGYSIKALVDGSVVPTGDGEFDKYEWKDGTLLMTPVTPDGQVIPGLTTTYALTAAGDLTMQYTIAGKPSNTMVLKRIGN